MPTQVLPPVPAEMSVSQRIRRLGSLVGERELVRVCAALLGGADPHDHPDHVAWLAGHRASVDELRESGWKDYWFRTWGARGLLYVWDDLAATDVVAGLDDPDWRPAEMCLKVAARHEVGPAGPGAARLAGHPLPRVRVTALRALGRVGDTEHVDVVRVGLDDPEEEVRRAAALALEAMVARLDLEEGPP